MHVDMRADLTLENIEAVWVELRQGGTKYLVSCIYRPPFTTTEYYDKIVDRFECAGMTEHPVISLGNLNSITFWMRLYLLIQSTILKLHMVCTSWLTNQHEWMIKPPLCWMSFLRPILHFIVRVQFLYTYWPLSYLHSYGIKKKKTTRGWSHHSEISWHETFWYREFLQWSNFMWHS